MFDYIFQIVRNIVVENTKYITYFVLILLGALTIKIISTIFQKIKRLLIDLKQKLSCDTRNIVNITKSLTRSELIDKKDFIKFPEDIKDIDLDDYRFLVKSGIALMFPEDVLQWYLGDCLDFTPNQNNCKDDSEMSVTIKQVIFKAKKLTKVIIEVSNIGNKTLNFYSDKNNKNKFKDMIELKLNHSEIVEFESVKLLDKQLVPNQSQEIQVSFSYLDKDIIRKIKNVQLKFVYEYRKNKKNFEFLFDIHEKELQEMEDKINKEFDLKKFFVVLSLGGFILFAIILNFCIGIIGNIAGGYLKYIIGLIKVSFYILAVNLNYKFIRIVFDFLNKNKD